MTCAGLRVLAAVLVNLRQSMEEPGGAVPGDREKWRGRAALRAGARDQGNAPRADHPDVAMTLNNLASLCRAQDPPVEADALYRRALSIFEPALPAEHPNLATCRENHAALVREMSTP